MQTVATDDAPQPAGHYAQAVAHNGFLFVSGQLPIDPGTGKPVDGTVEEQTDQALENVLELALRPDFRRQLFDHVLGH